MSSIYIQFIVCLIFTLKRLTSADAVDETHWLGVRPNHSGSINTLPFPNSYFKYKLRGFETRGLFTIFEAEYLTEGPGLHMHTKEDELFHIVDGQVQFYVDGKQFCAETGDYVYVPKNISQGIRVQNEDKLKKPVKIQIMLAPSGLEGFLDEIAPLYGTDQQDNITIHNEISEKYGIINLGNVDWKDLGCFKVKGNASINTNNNNIKADPTFSSLISFVKNIF